MTALVLSVVVTSLPPWYHDAAWRVMEAGVAAQLAETVEEGRQWIVEALDQFQRVVRDNGGTDWEWMVLAAAAADLIVQADPELYAGGDNAFCVEDSRTGEIIDDPDQDDDLADPQSRAALTAMRLLIAAANHDRDLFGTLFFAAGEDGSGAGAMILLVEMAGYAQVNARLDSLPEDARAAFLGREAETIANAPKRGPVKVTKSGRYVELPIDERDRDADVRALAAPHGPAVYLISAYQAGNSASRDQVVAGTHRALVGRAADDTPAELCGVQHSEDIEPFQVPYSARSLVNRQLRAAQRQTGHKYALVRCWQHMGPCPPAV